MSADEHDGDLLPVPHARSELERRQGERYSASSPAPPGAQRLLGEQLAPTGGPPPAPPGSGEQRLAGWWRRALATLVDALVLLLGAAVIVALFAIPFAADDAAGAVSTVVGVLVALAALVVASLLYPPIVMGRMGGQTLGKKLLGVRVVRTDGAPLDSRRAVLREVGAKWILFGFVGFAFTFGLALLLDVLWPLWDPERRALHDLLCRTRVVRA